MTDQDCDFETEKDSTLLSIKNKLNNVSQHHASSALLDNADMGLEKSDFVSDESMSKNNILPSVETQYIKVEYKPKKKTSNANSFNKRLDDTLMLVDIVLIVIICIVFAMILQLIITTNASCDIENSEIIYKILNNKINSDPILSEYRPFKANSI
jgi:hypothetical protein